MKIAFWLPKYGININDPCCYPLGAMYVSAYFKAAGHQVDVFNHNLWDYPIDVLADYDTVLMTGFDEFLPEVKRVAAYCSERGIKTHLGGAMAAFDTENMSKIVNYVYRKALPITGTLPDYEGFGLDEYMKRHSARYMGVISSVGCPKNCTFCRSVCKYSCRPLKEVFEEIGLYKKQYKIDRVVMNDNTLNASVGRFGRFIGGMTGKGLEWSAAIRLDNWNDELAREAKASGMSYAVVGVESLRQHKLDHFGKDITVDQIKRGLDLLEKYKIGYHGNIIFGAGNETVGEIADEYGEMISSGYRLFPTLLQPFVGIKERVSDALSSIDRRNLAGVFRAYVESNGMYMYPEGANV